MVTPMDLNHLGPAQQEIADRSDEERVRYILSDRWVPYRVAQLVEERFRFLIDFPRRSRMPCLLVSGDSGMGKSLMAEKFIRDYPTSFNEGTGATIWPTLSMEMPDEHTPQVIREELLGALGAPPGNSKPRRARNSGYSPALRAQRSIMRGNPPCQPRPTPPITLR